MTGLFAIHDYYLPVKQLEIVQQLGFDFKLGKNPLPPPTFSRTPVESLRRRSCFHCR